MLLSDIYKNIAIVFCAFFIISGFLAAVIPYILQSKIDNQIANNIILTSETSNSWGTVPGILNISSSKTYTIFNLTTPYDQIYQGVMNYDEVYSVTYDYAYNYTNLSYAENTDGSIYFQKIYELSLDEEDQVALENLTINQVNIGAMAGLKQQFSTPFAQQFVTNFYRLIRDFEQNFVPTYYASNIFAFYIQNQNAVNQTILNTQYFSQPQINQIWTDPLYGWSKNTTFTIWAEYLVYQDSATYDFLQGYFGLNSSQIEFLLGPNSVLQGTFLVAQGLITNLIGCPSSPCTYSEIIAGQWSNFSYAQTALFPTSQVFTSFTYWNQTYPSTPEIAFLINSTGATPFSQSCAVNLISYNTATLTPTGLTNTLLDPINIEYILDQYTSNPSNYSTNIQQYLDLDDVTQVPVIIDYIYYIVNNFTLRSDAFAQGSLELRTITDGIPIGLTSAISDIQSGIWNITGVAINAYFNEKGYVCDQFLNNNTNLSNLTNTFCTNPPAGCFFCDLTSLESTQYLISVYNQPQEWSTIESLTGATTDQIQSLFSNTTLYGLSIQIVASNFSTAMGINLFDPSVPYLQWANSTFTLNLPKAYFADGYLSVANYNPSYFGLKSPEFSTVALKYLNTTATIPVSVAQTLFTSNVGGLLSRNELYTFAVLSQNAATNETSNSSLLQRFGLEADLASYLWTYCQVTFTDYVLGGRVTIITGAQLLWGYNDNYLFSLTIGSILEGANPNADYYINIIGLQNNLAQLGSNTTILSTIDSGDSNLTNIRHITSYVGNYTIQIYQNNSVINPQYANPWNTDSPLPINGTDGTGFQPSLPETQDLYVFDTNLMRDIHYVNNGTIQINSYNLLTYTIAQDMFDVNPVFYTNNQGYFNLSTILGLPIAASYPYFYNCDSTTYEQLTIDGEPINPPDASALLVIEAITGFTFNNTQNFQYNIETTATTGLSYIMPNDYIVPLFYETTVYASPSSRLDSDLSDLQGQIHFRTLFIELFVIFALLSFAIAIFSFIGFKKQSKKIDLSISGQEESFMRNEV